MRERRRRAIDAWERMQPFLGPLDRSKPGSVQRVVVFVDHVEHLAAGRSVATGRVAGAPVAIDLRGRTLDGASWACLDITEAAEAGDDEEVRALQLLAIIDSCPAKTPKWSMRVHR